MTAGVCPGRSDENHECIFRHSKTALMYAELEKRGVPLRHMATKFVTFHRNIFLLIYLDTCTNKKSQMWQFQDHAWTNSRLFAVPKLPSDNSKSPGMLTRRDYPKLHAC